MTIFSHPKRYNCKMMKGLQKMNPVGEKSLIQALHIKD